MCVECLQDNNCPYLNACMQNSCTPNNECSTTEVICPSGDQCNLSSCDLDQGCITTALSNIPCNDNFPCTHADACINGTCQGQLINCLPPDTCSVGSCNIFSGQCMFESYCVAPTFCDNSIPQGQCLQCDDTHACPNNLLCVNGWMVKWLNC